MANEIAIRVSMTVRNGNIDYSSRPTAFNVTQSVAEGPTPGMVLVSEDGTDIDLSQLTTPGWTRFQNYSTTNFVAIGRWDPVENRFYPFLELKPGEHCIVRLSRHVEEEYVGTGTGTVAAATTLRAKANGGSVNLLVESFND